MTPRMARLALALGVLVAAHAAPAQAKPKTVWEDPAGDTMFPAPETQVGALGLDIVGGTIERVGDDLEFTVEHTEMPPIGSLPEAARFLWVFAVGKDNYRLVIKRADVGKPDVLANQTTERVGRVDVNGHFRLEGECTSTTTGVLNAINCEPLAYLEGTWDPASATVTMVVPMDLVGAKPGSVIKAGGGNALTICPICWVSHLAERSLDSTIIDLAAQTGKYRVPR